MPEHLSSSLSSLDTALREGLSRSLANYSLSRSFRENRKDLFRFEDVREKGLSGLRRVRASFSKLQLCFEPDRSLLEESVQAASSTSDRNKGQYLLLDNDFESWHEDADDESTTTQNFSARMRTEFVKAKQWLLLGLGAYAESVNPSLAFDAESKRQSMKARSGYHSNFPYSL